MTFRTRSAFFALCILFQGTAAFARAGEAQAIEAFEADSAVKAALNGKQSEPAQAARILSGRVGGGLFETYVVTQLIDTAYMKTKSVVATVHYDPSDKAVVTVMELKPLEKPRQAGAAANEEEAFETDPEVLKKIDGAKTEKTAKLEIATGYTDDGEAEDYLLVKLVHPKSGPGPSRAVMALVHTDPISLTVQQVELVEKKK